jgi:ABC-type multidrug transport system fused ATPase/permease subunit
MTPSNIESNELQRQKRFLSFLFSKKVRPLPTDDERKPYPQKSVNLISRAFFWWLLPVMSTGYNRTLDPQDLYYLTDDIKVQAMAAQFYIYFEKGYEKAKRKHLLKKCAGRGETLDSSSVDESLDIKDFKLPKFTTIFAIIQTFRFQYFKACFYLALAYTGLTTNPLLIKKLITYVELKAFGIEQGIGKGLGYSFGSAILIMVIGMLLNHFFYCSMLTGAQAKAVLTKAILEKSFRLNEESKHKFTTGKITSMMGTDLARIDFALGFQPFIIVFPIPIAIAIGILVSNIGWPAVIGIAILFIFMMGIAMSTKKLFEYRASANKFTDARVNFIKEALNNLKVIKFYSWEPPYHENISDIRRKEMKIIYRMQILRNIVTAFAFSLTLFSSMIAFLVLYAVNKGKNKDPAAIFSSVSLFNVLTQQVILLPMALAAGADALIGLTRVGEFFGAAEIDPEEKVIDATLERQVIMDDSNESIVIDNASFKWEIFKQDEAEDDKKDKEENEKVVQDQSDSNTKTETYTFNSSEKMEDTESTDSKDVTFPGLDNINLNIKKGEFIVITGLVGSGKSSLLQAISGFMRRTSGSVSVNGSLLLCGYPWVQNATVKQNIIFGCEEDEKRYNDVIYACSLESDLEILPAGDQSEIGERGITLSGGQKARINLARAVYANKDIILLDDVLSAVDARVGKHIMNNCILGLLKDKTRILATHQLSLIGAADRIIFLNGDGSISVGTFDELKSNPGFSKLMAYSSETKDDEDEEEVEFVDEQTQLEEQELIKRQVTNKSKADEEAIRRDFNKNKNENGVLIEKEEKAVNSIDFAVYATYFKLGSGKIPPGFLLPVLLLVMISATFCQLFTNTWLSFWTSDKFHGRPSNFYIGIYVMFTFMSFIMLTIEFVILVFITNTASVRLNILSIGKILHSPMSFMDTTPMGRILNRFTKDTDVLDNEIGDQLRFFLFSLCNILGVLILCVIYLPWFAIALPFLGLLFYSIADFYQASSREVKRLEAIQRSLVYNNFNEVLSGMDTIKAYRAESRFLMTNDTLINNMNEAYYITIANQRWLGIHMDIVATMFALLIALLSVFRVFNIGASSVGLLLSYVFQVAGQLSMLIRTFTQVENEMNSAERLCEYAYKLPTEAAYVITETSPKPSWPEHGSIKFDDVSLAYRPGLPLVLKNLSFDIKPSEKIGICGRTGAGKSSIMTALYRLSELDSGEISIDDVNISSLGLQQLRSKLSIIPQDPVLFRGSIRKNLDPFHEQDDSKLWDALRRTGLIEASKLEAVKQQVLGEDTTESHKFHLDQAVEDDGVNFSLGERQLIAFARALVRDSKILILDEATSSVDYETDAKIQETIIKEFSQCTILCIAHRLKTIINYDKILVLDKGELKEFDTPLNLFHQEGSIFQQMCERSNITVDDFSKVSKF